MRITACCLVVCLLAVTSVRAQSNSQGSGPGLNDLEQLARQAQDNQHDHVTALADAAMHGYNIPGLKEAVVNAHQKGETVTLEELADLHNHIVDVLGFPDYAKVDVDQLQHIQMFYGAISPTLVRLSPRQGEPPTKSTHILSPIAAALIEEHLIFQKRWNPFYQFAPGQWNKEKGRDAVQMETYNRIERGEHASNETREIHAKLQAGIHVSDMDGVKLLLHAKRTFKLSTLDVAKIAASFGLEAK